MDWYLWVFATVGYCLVGISCLYVGIKLIGGDFCSIGFPADLFLGLFPLLLSFSVFLPVTLIVGRLALVNKRKHKKPC